MLFNPLQLAMCRLTGDKPALAADASQAKAALKSGASRMLDPSMCFGMTFSGALGVLGEGAGDDEVQEQHTIQSCTQLLGRLPLSAPLSGVVRLGTRGC